MKCSKCKKHTPQSGFATYRDRQGELKRRGVCKVCRQQYAQDNFERLQQWRKEYNAGNRTKAQARSARMRAETKAFVDEYKKKPCADCKGTFPPVVMDLDHVSGAKVTSVARMVGCAYKLDLIKEEIEKCEVVCSNCHRIRTAARRENLAPPMKVLPRKATGSTSRRRS